MLTSGRTINMSRLSIAWVFLFSPLNAIADKVDLQFSKVSLSARQPCTTKNTSYTVVPDGRGITVLLDGLTLDTQGAKQTTLNVQCRLTIHFTNVVPTDQSLLFMLRGTEVRSGTASSALTVRINGARQ